MIDRTILDAAVARVALSESKNELLLRGSYLTSHWVGASVRKCDDLDFLALGAIDFARLTTAFRHLLATDLHDHIRFETNQMHVEKIFEETDAPGLRLTVPVYKEDCHTVLQIDIAFNDPLPEPPSETSFETTIGKFQLIAASPEMAFGWKLHGLVEREGLSWRAKDMADLWLLQKHFQFDPLKLAAAIKIAFESRDGPLWRLDRLLNRDMGRSSGSRRRYARFLRDFTFDGLGYPAEIPQLVSGIASVVIDPITQLKQEYQQTNGRAYPTPHDFPVDVSLAEIQTVCDKSIYRSYPWNNGCVVVQERPNSEHVALHHAATFSQHRQILLQNEARGVTFNARGQLLARPYTQFGKRLTIDDVDRFNQHQIDDSDYERADVFEKLDGSLIFPTADEASPMGWQLRTRRGCSDIADNALQFASDRDQVGESQYYRFVEHCLSHCQTPIFEWCSRSRWIVFDHPQDRLVLTGIRDNRLGTLMNYGEMEAISSRFQIELVRRLAKPQTLRELVVQTAIATKSEGCILRLSDSRQFKIKSRRYVWLHRAVEGPNRDRARWYLWATGVGTQLKECSAGREMDLGNYLHELDFAVANFAEPIRKLIGEFDPALSESRKQLAEHIRDQSSLRTRLAFLAFDGACLETEMRKIIGERCQNEQLFRSIARKLNGPIWND